MNLLLTAAISTTPFTGAESPQHSMTASSRGICWLMKERPIQWPKGINETQLLDCLNRIGIAVQGISPEAWDASVTTCERMPFPPSANQPEYSEEIWRGKTVVLIVSGDRRLRISPLRSVKTLADLSPDEMIEMEETALKMSAVFDATLKTVDYHKWIPLGKEAGQIGDQLYMELIPGQAFDGADLDVAEKLRVDLYTLMNDKTACDQLLKEQVEAIKALAPTILSQTKTCLEPTTTPIRGWKNIATAAQLMGNAILLRLYQKQGLVVPVVTSADAPQKKQKKQQELPRYFAHALNEIMGQPVPALSEEEMASMREQIGPLFKKISVVVFDFGGVVNLSDGADDIAFIAKAFGLQLPLARVKELFWEEVKPLNIGQINEKTFWARFAAASQGQVPENWDQLWKDHYLAHHASPNQQIVALVKRLKQAGYLTPLLSDTIPSHAECNQPLYAHFDPLVLSTQSGFKKPDTRSYQSLLTRIDCAPSECVFIDDLEKNVKGAQAAGMHAIPFTSYETLVKDLKSLDVDVQDR